MYVSYYSIDVKKNKKNKKNTKKKTTETKIKKNIYYL